MYHCHTTRTLYASFFVSRSSHAPSPLLLCCLFRSCFSCLLNRDVLIWGPLSQPQGSKSLVLLISCKIRHVHRSPLCALWWLIMQCGAGTDNQRCSLTHVFPVNHTSTGMYAVEGLCVGPSHCGVARWLDTREQEWDGACDFPSLGLFFLLLTVRWMIAITGAISETEWRSTGQRDTAMGNQPSD